MNQLKCRYEASLRRTLQRLVLCSTLNSTLIINLMTSAYILLSELVLYFFCVLCVPAVISQRTQSIHKRHEV